MKLSICTIQRDRARWLAEWVGFHYVVGFRKFFIYLHKCKDDSADTVLALQKLFDIECFTIPDDTPRPQFASYQHAYNTFGHTSDWMAFIDGDEFLFPTNDDSLEKVLNQFQYQPISALGVWWSCFGSNAHIKEPDGLVIDNYQRRASFDFEANRHIKSIVRGHQGSHFSVNQNAHIFNTIYGTYDENLRQITSGFMPDLEPTYSKLRINHYVCQSYEYFKQFKQHSGAADAGPLAVRSDEWWTKHDRNDVLDNAILQFRPQLLEVLKGA